MSSEIEARDLVRRVAQGSAGGSIKETILRVARRLRWSATRTKAIWYAEARRIDAAEMDQLRALAAEQAARYTRVAAAMQAVDPDLYQQDIAALVRAARQLGGEDQS